jgi:hypothetical protein
LRPFVTAQQQDHKISIIAEIQPVTWTMVDAGFVHAFSYRLQIRLHTRLEFADHGVDPGFRSGVRQPCEAVTKGAGAC